VRDMMPEVHSPLGDVQGPPCWRAALQELH